MAPVRSTAGNARRIGIATAFLMVMASALLSVTGSPAGADSTLNDSRVVLSVCPGGNCAGVRVYMDPASNHFGSSGYSFCTKDETSTDFVPSSNADARELSMVVKNEGSCFARNSYNVWIIAAYQGGKLLGQTLVWIGQDIALGHASYYAKCDGRDPWGQGEPRLTCAKVDGYAANPLYVRVALPGPPPPPSCPSAGSTCYLQVRLDSGVCASFRQEKQTCKGSSDGTAGWSVKYGVTQFSWTTEKNGQKVISYQVVEPGGSPSASISGTVANEGSGALVATEAYSTAGPFPGSRWYSPTTGTAGKEGGPLHFDFSAGRIGAVISIDGWLQRRP
jgi:hypothetical protein